MTEHRLHLTYSSSMSERTWRITKCPGRSRSATNYLAASPARSSAASYRTAPAVRRHFPMLRATAELLNAANGLRPIAREGYVTLPVFAFGWPTSEMSMLSLTGSVLDAVRRGLRGDFRGARGRIALVLTAIAWVLSLLIQRRDMAAKPYFVEPLREALGDDYEEIAS